MKGLRRRDYDEGATYDEGTMMEGFEGSLRRGVYELSEILKEKGNQFLFSLRFATFRREYSQANISETKFTLISYNPYPIPDKSESGFSSLRFE